jgi:hypothetical protein
MRDHRGYLQRVSQLYSLWGLLPTAWQTAVVGLVSGVGGYLGFRTGGLFYAVIGAVFVFTAGMIGLFFTILVIRQTGIFGKLAVREIGVADFGVDTQGQILRELKFLTMNFAVQNNSFRDIHFRVIRANLTVLNNVNQDAVVSEFVNIIPSGQFQQLAFATIASVKLPKIDISRLPTASPITGKVEIELAYGPNNQALIYAFSYEANLSFGCTIARQHRGHVQQVNLKVISAIKRYHHKQAYSNG